MKNDITLSIFYYLWKYISFYFIPFYLRLYRNNNIVNSIRKNESSEDIDPKIILLDYQNHYVERIMKNVTKNFDILTIILSVLHRKNT